MFYKLLNVYSRQFPFPRRGLKYFLKMAKSLGIEDKTYTKRLPGNFYMQLNPAEHIQQQLFWYGYYEKELGDLFKKIIRPGDVFLDVGANIGYFSLLAARGKAKVFSFEPAKKIFEKLQLNISINNIKNITCINAAAGEINEKKDLFLSATDNQGMSSFQQPENYTGKTEKVKVVAIDNWFQTSGLSEVNIIKIDVEGSELAALKGMKNILENFNPVIIVEINPETLSMFRLSPFDIPNYLNKLNFDGFLICKNGKLAQLNHEEVTRSVNVLFIHPEKKKLYPELFKN